MLTDQKLPGTYWQETTTKTQKQKNKKQNDWLAAVREHTPWTVHKTIYQEWVALRAPDGPWARGDRL